MLCDYACRSPEHEIARGRFLGGIAGSLVSGLGCFAHPVAAARLAADQKRILVVYPYGGMSQLESWDPKPGTISGGPFRAIPSTVPGLHVSELMPQTAQLMHHLALVRSMNTKENDHGKGTYLMMTGRRQTPALSFPQLGAVAAKALAPEEAPLPGHIEVRPSGNGSRRSDSAYLGPEYASVLLGNGNPPENSQRPDSVSQTADSRRHAFRRAANARFAARRRTAHSDVYTYNYERALQLMERREVFDVDREPAHHQQRYGEFDLGRHLLLARRLLERGVTYVKVWHRNYDTHNENFNFHLEQMAEFDQAFSALISDLVDRGMFESTLVIVMSEFGRTPKINENLGRDHWSSAWSVALGGAGIQRGAVLGKTNQEGTAIVGDQYDHAQMFHTYLSAVGVDSTSSFDIAGRLLPLADPAAAPIDELLT